MRTKASLYAILMLAMALGVLAGCSRKATPTDAQITIEIQSKLLVKKMSFHLYVNPIEIKSV